MVVLLFETGSGYGGLIEAWGWGRTHDSLDADESGELGPLFVCVVDGYIQGGGDGGKGPVVMCVFGRVDAAHPHVQTRTIEIPRLVVSNADGRDWPGLVVSDIGPAVANAPTVARGSRPRIACGGSSCVGTELGGNTALAPYRATCSQRTRIEVSQGLAICRRLGSRLQWTADGIVDALWHWRRALAEADLELSKKMITP